MEDLDSRYILVEILFTLKPGIEKYMYRYTIISTDMLSMLITSHMEEKNTHPHSHILVLLKLISLSSYPVR